MRWGLVIMIVLAGCATTPVENPEDPKPPAPPTVADSLLHEDEFPLHCCGGIWRTWNLDLTDMTIVNLTVVVEWEATHEWTEELQFDLHYKHPTSETVTIGEWIFYKSGPSSLHANKTGIALPLDPADPDRYNLSLGVGLCPSEVAGEKIYPSMEQPFSVRLEYAAKPFDPTHTMELGTPPDDDFGEDEC